MFALFEFFAISRRHTFKKKIPLINTTTAPKKNQKEEETTKQREIFLEKVEKWVFSLHSQSLRSSFVISYKKRN